MDRKLVYKLLAIGFFSLLLLIPLYMIENQIRNRSQLQSAVQEEIAQTAAGSQTLVGPILVINYDTYETHTEAGDTGESPKTRIHKVSRSMTLPAAHLDVRGNSAVESRSRGIYSAQLFHANLVLSGQGRIPPHLGLDEQSIIENPRASLVLGVTDPRGISNIPEVKFNGHTYQFSVPNDHTHHREVPGNQLVIPLGPIDTGTDTMLDFSFPLNLTGSGALAIAPTAERTTVSLNSNWPHPSFQGRFLPRQRHIHAEGFEAQWEISHLARNFRETLTANEPNVQTRNHSAPRGEEVLRIYFVDPVNIYLKSERAVKYGSLFIALTFAALFLGEIMRRKPMHPLQYLLVGLALSLFFLLLIALSEHLPFLIAYLGASLACITLITVYLAGALGSTRHALAFGAGFTGLYGILYGVLHSEDNALLMGSLLLFVALSAIMIGTRHLNWYKLGTPLAPPGTYRVPSGTHRAPKTDGQDRGEG